MARQIFTSREMPYGHYGLRSFRIEVDLTEHHHPLQRHIWTRDDGSVDAEEWVRSIPDTPERLIANGWSAVEPAKAAAE